MSAIDRVMTGSGPWRKALLLVVFISPLLSLELHAEPCDDELAAIDAALAAGPDLPTGVELQAALEEELGIQAPLPPDPLDVAIGERDEGAALCAAGDDAGAAEHLAVAKYILRVDAAE